MLASDSVKTINGIEKQAIVEMYSSKTEIFGYSEEEALKVIGQYISFANYDLLHDASVAADENGDFIIDENGHLDINFDRDVLSSDTNAVQPFFPKVTEDSIVDDIKEFVVGDQQIINAVEELETINGDNGYSELYSSMNDKAALDEEIVRTCPHRVNVRIFRHNFVGGKAKIRRRAVALQGFLTKSPAKFDEKTCMNPYVDRF